MCTAPRQQPDGDQMSALAFELSLLGGAIVVGSIIALVGGHLHNAASSARAGWVHQLDATPEEAIAAAFALFETTSEHRGHRGRTIKVTREKTDRWRYSIRERDGERSLGRFRITPTTHGAQVEALAHTVRRTAGFPLSAPAMLAFTESVGERIDREVRRRRQMR